MRSAYVETIFCCKRAVPGAWHGSFQGKLLLDWSQWFLRVGNADNKTCAFLVSRLVDGSRSQLVWVWTSCFLWTHTSAVFVYSVRCVVASFRVEYAFGLLV